MNIIKNTARFTEIVSTFARYGFSLWIEKLKLNRYVTKKQTSIKEQETNYLPLPHRLKLAFESLGPTFIKFGQILASRSDLLPEPFIEAFSSLHDQVTSCDFKDIEIILKKELGEKFKDFKKIDPTALGSASIAQVHEAQLINGQKLVLKIQKPEVVETIKEDLNLLTFIASLIHSNIPELKPFGLPNLVEEFAQSLQRETLFFLEANNIKKFKNIFITRKTLKVPEVYWQYTTQKVLALEKIEGFPLSHPQALQTIKDPQLLASEVLRNYLEQVFIHGFFHGDLHPGNLIILTNQKTNDPIWSLIDFGLMGRLSGKTKFAIIKMLKALAQEDYAQLANEYIYISDYSPKLVFDRFAQGLTQTISPYYGLELSNINTGALLLKTANLASKEGLQIPRELLLFFKSLVGVESIIRKINPHFDFLSESLQFAQSLETQGIVHDEWKKSILLIAQDSEHLIKELPRQIHFYLKKINSIHNENLMGGSGFQKIEVGFRKLSLALFFGLLGLGLLITIALLLVFSKENPHNLVLIFTIILGAGIAWIYLKL